MFDLGLDPEQEAEVDEAGLPLFAHFGFTIAMTQSLELLLVQAIGFARLQRARPGKIFDADGLLDAQLGQTLGPLTNQLEDLLGDEFSPADTVARALVTRNYLVHNFWRTRSLLLATSDGRAQISLDLKSSQSTISAAIEEVTAFTERQRATLGLTGERMDELMNLAMAAMTNEEGNLDASWLDLPAADWPAPGGTQPGKK